MGLLLLQFLVLAFTAAVWWLARRDLTARAAEAQAPVRAEWEELRATVARLIADLEQRAEAADQRLTARIAEADALRETPLLAPVAVPPPAPTGYGSGNEESAPVRPEHDTPFAQVHELSAAGITDPVEIARRTGLGRGEVELILGLRARRAL